MTVIWKKFQIFLLILILMGLFYCSKNNDTKSSEDKIKKGNSYQTSKIEKTKVNEVIDKESVDFSKKLPLKSVIKEVSLSSHGSREDSGMKVNIETHESLKENQYITFIYWRNGKKISETREDMLPSESYKRGDFIFADVLLYQDGQLIEKKRTKVVQLLNILPVIKDVIFPKVDGLGTYEISVKAEDEDKDQLTFSLESGELPVDMKIDPLTGVVNLVLTEETPRTLKFIVVVDDGNGGVVKKEITLKFFKEPEKSD